MNVLESAPDVKAQIDALYRSESRRVYATLVRLLKLQARLNVRMPELPAPLEP